MRGWTAVDIDDRGVLSVAGHVERHVEESRNRPLAVAAGIVHQIGLDHVFRAHPRHEGMRYGMRLAGRQRIHPQIPRSGGPVVVIEQA